MLYKTIIQYLTKLLSIVALLMKILAMMTR